MAPGKSDRDPADAPDLPPLPSIPRQYAPIVRTEDDTHVSHDSTRQLRIQDAQPQTTYGSIGSFDTSVPESSPGERQGSQGDLLSPSTAIDPLRSPIIPPQVPERSSRKPSIGRRLSFKPHRGQEFSVDDDVTEYEEDNALRQASAPHTSPRIGPMGGRSAATLRRRTNPQPSTLPRVDSRDEDGDEEQAPETSRRLSDEVQSWHARGDGNGDVDSVASGTESFTLKDRQEAINETHPFGIRIWKPALYKKFRSVEKTAEGDIHSVPGERVSHWLFLFNLLWSLFFGWWLALAALLSAVACFLLGFFPDGAGYGRVFLGLSGYLLYPFGAFVLLEGDENYAEEDEGEGRSISEYEQWQSGDLEHGRLFFGPLSNRSLVGRRRNSLDSASEHDSLLGRTGRRHRDDSTVLRTKRRFFGRGEWTFGRVIFYTFFYFLVGPLMLLVSLICWMLVFWIPMGRVTLILFYHLRRHPLALSFHSDVTYTRSPEQSSSSILLCTYRAAGLKYWKYTVDGTNIFFINLLGIVLFTIIDYWVLHLALGMRSWLTNPGLIFTLALFSVVPLAYFIGQAVASISAQSSMGLGAAVNAFFSTVVEVYLYCVALTEGKAQLVEGSIIGSIFAGILFLPGLSMCFGAIIRKTQRFNVKSAGVTSTMLLFAVIAAFGPTLFYQIYGSHELNCLACTKPGQEGQRDCRRCYFSQLPAAKDAFFVKAVQPYSWFAAALLFFSYIIGLWFTLRTHAAVIWSTEGDEKKAAHLPHDSTLLGSKHHVPANGVQSAATSNPNTKGSIRESQLYARILGQSLKQVGLAPTNADSNWEQLANSTDSQGVTPHVVPPKTHEARPPNLSLPGLSEEQNEMFVRQVAEVAATAATVAARDASRSSRKTSLSAQPTNTVGGKTAGGPASTIPDDNDDPAFIAEPHSAAGSHDAPNWSKMKSFIILLVATLSYAVIAEILVNTVDVVLESVDIDEKFLGITLFALVPNTTEFLNAISFAMNGNIALSMEIGSAYALQVCLLQIPTLVLFSAIHTQFVDPAELSSHSFNLLFPQWDMVTVILCFFLLSYMYGEGKSNYFKGSILVLTYLVVVMGFFLSGYNNLDGMGVDRFDTLALGTSERFWTIGRGRHGRAY